LASTCAGARGGLCADGGLGPALAVGIWKGAHALWQQALRRALGRS